MFAIDKASSMGNVHWVTLHLTSGENVRISSAPDDWWQADGATSHLHTWVGVDLPTCRSCIIQLITLHLSILFAWEYNTESPSDLPFIFTENVDQMIHRCAQVQPLWSSCAWPGSSNLTGRHSLVPNNRSLDRTLSANSIPFLWFDYQAPCRRRRRDRGLPKSSKGELPLRYPASSSRNHQLQHLP